MRHGFKLAAAIMFAAGGASAQVTTDGVIQDLGAQGYSRIEVANGPTQMKVEAIRGTEKLEIVYDTASGAVLETATEAVRASDNTSPGVQVRTRSRDFVDAGSGSASGIDDDSSDDTDSTDDGTSDDHDDKGHGGDDGGDDDHGGEGRGSDD